MTLGQRIRAYRLRRGWSQAELSRRSHVRAALLSELERDIKRDTTGAVLLRIAEALGVGVGVLLGSEHESNDETHRVPASVELGKALATLTG